MTSHPPTNQPHEVPVRAVITVAGGLIPGQAATTRQWVFTAFQPAEALAANFDDAVDYARELADPNRLNWVHLEWVWF